MKISITHSIERKKLEKKNTISDENFGHQVG